MKVVVCAQLLFSVVEALMRLRREERKWIEEMRLVREAHARHESA